MIDVHFYNETMADIKKRLVEQKEILEKNGISLDVKKGNAENTIGNETIDSLIEKSTATSFKLLAMGHFSSGKSALINVLLGEKLLPEKATPATALITEINYGKEKKVIMYPRPGEWKGGDAPFEIEPTLAEIKKYSTINNKAGLNSKEANRVNSMFEKMVIYWPLEMLKGGVSIIDSPGTNDPYCNDYIVEEYVPKADAILYCICAAMAYDIDDKRTLDKICGRGFRPVIATTYFDVIKKNNDEDDINDFLDTTMDKYKLHTTQECCHFLDSLTGMNAKINNDNIAYVESGYSEFEKFLGEYLSENKGKEKINLIVNETKKYNTKQIETINGIISNLNTPIEEFNKRVEEANHRLSQAEKQSELIKREFDLETDNILGEIKKITPSLYNELLEVNLEGFEPDTSFSLMHPKKSSQQMAEECSIEIKRRNDKIVTDWVNNKLKPKINDSFKSISEKMEQKFETFSNDIENAKIAVSVEAGKAKTGNGAGTNVAMFAYALLTGDWMTAVLGSAFGAGAFGRTLLCEFAAAVILLIVSCFTPVGLTAMVVASVAAMVTGVAWNVNAVSKKIKKSTVQKTKENITKNRNEIISNVETKCYEEIVVRAKDNLDKAIAADISSVRQSLSAIQGEREKYAADIEKRKEELNRVSEYLNETIEKMDSIMGLKI